MEYYKVPTTFGFNRHVQKDISLWDCGGPRNIGICSFCFEITVSATKGLGYAERPATKGLGYAEKASTRGRQGFDKLYLRLLPYKSMLAATFSP